MLFQRFRFNDNNQFGMPVSAWENGKEAVKEVVNKIINQPPIETLNVPDGTGNEELDELIEVAGYSYDPQQDIFISRLHPWQRSIGYCRLFDETASLSGMIIDSEPIHFDYNGRKWMIGIWKGQYDMVTGGEIGLYKGVLNFNIPGISSGLYYRSAGDKELLQMSYTLNKNGKTLFTREGKHWWLTGFKLGEFSQPSELSMDVNITLNNTGMRDAFLAGLRHAGYSDNEISVKGNTVSFTFDVPHTPQPVTRTKATDWVIQKKNKFLCDEFEEITGSHNTIQKKVQAMEEHSPQIYQKFIGVGHKKQSFEILVAAIIVTIIVLYLLSLTIEPED